MCESGHGRPVHINLYLAPRPRSGHEANFVILHAANIAVRPKAMHNLSRVFRGNEQREV